MPTPAKKTTVAFVLGSEDVPRCPGEARSDAVVVVPPDGFGRVRLSHCLCLVGTFLAEGSTRTGAAGGSIRWAFGCALQEASRLEGIGSTRHFLVLGLLCFSGGHFFDIEVRLGSVAPLWSKQRSPNVVGTRCKGVKVDPLPCKTSLPEKEFFVESVLKTFGCKTTGRY